MNAQTSTRNARRAAFALKQHTVLARNHRIFDELVANESLSSQAIIAMQRERAAAHAKYAMENTTFYRDFYSAAGFTPADLTDPDAFDELPIVEKHHVREHFEQFKTPEATDRTAVVAMTGGSTGQPLHLLRDKRVSAQPLEWRLFRWWGVHPSDHIAIVWRQFRTDRQRMVHAAQVVALQADPARRVPNQRGERPRVRHSLAPPAANPLHGLRRWRARVRPHPRSDRRAVPPPVAIATTASPLTEENRLEIARILQAPVYDHYRSAEIPWMGGECRQRSGHHIFADARVVEVVDDAGGRYEIKSVTSSRQTSRTGCSRSSAIGSVIGRRRSRTRAVRCLAPANRPCDRQGGRRTAATRRHVDRDRSDLHMFSKQPAAVRQFQVHQRADHSVRIRCSLGSVA